MTIDRIGAYIGIEKHTFLSNLNYYSLFENQYSIRLECIQK